MWAVGKSVSSTGGPTLALPPTGWETLGALLTAQVSFLSGMITGLF